MKLSKKIIIFSALIVSSLFFWLHPVHGNRGVSPAAIYGSGGLAAPDSDDELQQQQAKALQKNQKQLQYAKHISKQKSSTISPSISSTEISLNNYYEQQETNPALAKAILMQLVVQEPDNVTAQKEMAYLFLEKDDDKNALPFLERAEKLDPTDYAIKAQLAYSYNALGMDKKAFYKFAEATKSTDPKIRLESEQAMVNLAGTQTRIFPDPYFADLYFAPWYLFRFSDTIYPAIARLGRNFGTEETWQVYGIVYFNKDTQSTEGSVSNIVADNSVIGDLGIRYTPWSQIPLYAYLEFGQAYNIIPDPTLGQTTWQYDLRGGFDFYTTWGATGKYADTLRFPCKQVGDTYADLSYYSIYGHDWIGQWIVREGVRVLEYKNSSVDLYLKMNALGDTLHEFYNNAIETGVGMAIMPYNLLNIRFRFELARGFYIPVTTPENSPNPYGSNYNASLVMLETYFSF